MRTQGVSARSSTDSVYIVLRVSEGDIRMVDAYYDELALDASMDRSPPTPEERIDLEKIECSMYVRAGVA